MVITTAQLHSTKPELRFSNPVRGGLEIRDGEDLWQWSLLEIRLNAFRRSTIPQKRFIIIIKDPTLRLSSALPYSSCHFANHKSVFLQSLHHPSVSWKTTPMYFFRSNIKYFAQQEQMKVQVFEIFKCSGRISPNSCHFWNNRSVFLQILHHPSGSWDIHPLCFLTKILYTSRSLSKCKFVEILCEQSKVWNFAFWWAPFFQIMYNFS